MIPKKRNDEYKKMWKLRGFDPHLSVRLDAGIEIRKRYEHVDDIHSLRDEVIRLHQQVMIYRHRFDALEECLLKTKVVDAKAYEEYELKSLKLK